MINNLKVLESVERLLQKDLQKIENKYESQLKNATHKLALQRKTPWGQLTQPETTYIGYYYQKYGENIAWAGMAIDAVVLAGMAFTGLAFATSGILNDVGIIHNLAFTQSAKVWFQKMVQYGTIPVLLTSPFVGSFFLKLHLHNRFIEDEKLIQNAYTDIENRKVNIQRALNAIQDLYQNPEDNFLTDFLTHVDLNQNEMLYNKKLFLLLAQVSNDPSSKNLSILAQYLRTSVPNTISTSKKVASPEFLENEFVKKLVREY